MFKQMFITACAAITISLTIFPVSAQESIPQSREQISLSFAPLVKKVAPAVVNIYTKRKVTVQYRSPFFNDPFFSMFMDDRIFGGRMRSRVENSLGSGVIVNENGLIVTNAHVIENADEIKVILRDGRELEATLALQDDASDLALLKITDNKTPLPFVSLKPSESLEVGDLVLAIGNPFGVGQTVTSGIVSAKGRSALDVNDFNFFIQTDAAINPGNSGGALVSLDGGVVGINTAIYSRDGGSLGIGFAVPSEMVASVIAAESAGQSGKDGIKRPWLGVEAQSLTADIASSLGLDTPKGVLIASLHPASPMKKAGIKAGDVITHMNGAPLTTPQEMKFRMATTALGQSAEFTILRAGDSKIFQVKAIKAPETPPRQETDITNNAPLNGATIANINPAVAEELNIPPHLSSGVIITRIKPRSIANRFAKAGDIILSINGTDIKTVKDAVKAIKSAPQGWDITILSNGRKQRIMLR